jgi:TetR/AcrR family acrAB operon transcriptional repressor
MARKTKAEAEQTRRQIIDAARCVFHECGVSRTTMEKVAHVAGVSRGAVYWHFENKAALFFAMRDESTRELDEVRATLNSPDIADPLDAIERSLLQFIGAVENNPLVRQTFEIMSLRCEYVDEFTGVLQELNKPCLDFLARLKPSTPRRPNSENCARASTRKHSPTTRYPSPPACSTTGSRRPMAMTCAAAHTQ